MKKQLFGDELVLSILEKEMVSLTKKAAKAKAECEESLSSPTKLMALRAEGFELIKNGMSDMPKAKLTKLEELAAQEKKLLAIMRNGNLVKLMDAEHEAEIAVANLAEVIASLKFRVNVKKQKGAAA